VTDAVQASNDQLQNRMSERDKLADELKLTLTRLRSVVRGFYGPDSNEYQQVGGTRASDRKRPIRRNEAETEAVAAANGNGTVS
jgi:hypothetical protein